MDETTRHLERRWRETGGADDETALLRARIRDGSLAEPRARLAAYVGHAPARDAIARAGVAPETIGLWAWGLKDVARLAAARGAVSFEATCLRAGVAVARRCARERSNDAVASDLDVLERWIVAPTDAHRQAALAVGRRLEEEARAALPLIVRLIARVIDAPDPEKGAALSNAVNVASDLLRGPEPVRAAIRDELVPWLLGRGDPVAERAASS